MIDHLGRYEITGELGRGAMGVVYKAYDPLIERTVAIKTINLGKLSDADRAEYETRFYREAKAAGRLTHPNIVTVHDLGKSEDTAYIAMELMEGRDLEEILRGHARVLLTDALNITIQVASGLHYAHQHGIVHGDIKPSNIMVLGDNQVKIADFGIARIITSEPKEEDEAVFGTPSFMSPEQIQGRKIDARSDIFSLGVVLYDMLTHRLPFPAEKTVKLKEQLATLDPEKPSAMNPSIPTELDAIIYKCLAKDPDERYQIANDLANDLRDCLAGLLHALGDTQLPVINDSWFRRLRNVVSPRSFTRQLSTNGTYFAMVTMLAIYLIDMLLPPTIPMNILYIFPLIVITLHCERGMLIGVAVGLALLLQGLNLMNDDIPLSSKIVIGLMVAVVDIVIVFLARLARINYIEVEQLSSFDRLTGLRNRLSFETILDVEIDRHKVKKAPFSFAYIDLHKLNELNQSRGYTTGDRAIKLVAKVIRESMRQLDTPSRISGDKFGILMPNTSAIECSVFCKELSAKIAKVMQEESLALSTDTGHVTFENSPASVTEIFDTSESAMHRAKASGAPFAVSA
jgi:diguanylate cyclase (GGDEF)-like protein